MPASSDSSPATQTGSRPLRRDAQANRQRLLRAAREVFAESGLEATLDEVAARAGVGVGTAYRNFANKDELIAALSQDRIARVSEILDRALAEPDPWQGIVTYLQGWLAMHAGDQGLKEMFLSTARYRQLDEEARAHLRARLDDLVARAQRRRVLRPGIEATDITLIQVMLSALPGPGGENAAATWRRFLPLALDGLKAGHEQPLPGRALSDDELDEAVKATRNGRQGGA